MSSRWSYKVIDMKSGLFGLKPDAIEQALNQEGMQGWELVAVSLMGTTARAYLKKEM